MTSQLRLRRRFMSDSLSRGISVLKQISTERGERPEPRRGKAARRPEWRVLPDRHPLRPAPSRQRREVRCVPKVLTGVAGRISPSQS